MAVTGCSDDREPEATTGPGPGGDDVEVGGPLTVTSGGGGMAFYPPPGNPAQWVATQGSFKLCTDGEPVTLDAVRYRATVEPLDVTGWLVSDATGPYSTFGSVLGSPPNFDEPYGAGDDSLTGQYTDQLTGAVIDDPCPSQGVRDGYSELLVEVRSGTTGVDIRRMWVDYTVDERRYTAPVQWRIIMCGTDAARGCPRNR